MEGGEVGDEGGLFARSATVTVLFTDVVGSTEALDRLGEDANAAAMRRHFDVLRAAIGAEQGEEVKNLGDGLMVVYRSALAAVRSGVAMQQALADAAARGEDVLGLRVGIHTGEARQESGDWHGGTVVIAKRLCDLAGTNEILCSDAVRQVVGRGFGVPFAAHGPTVLKGLREPVLVHQVLWRADALAPEPPTPTAPPGPIPLPRPLATSEAATDATPFVGRGLELGQVAAAWQRVLDARAARLLLVAGPPGIGKSTLAREFARRRHADGTTVLFGRCDPDPVMPFQPVAEAIQHLPAEVAARLPAVARTHIARLAPAGAQRAPTGDPDLERFLLFDAVVQLLRTVAERGPLVFVVDDLHWAGDATLLLLRHVLIQDDPIPVLVLATVRDGEPDEHGVGNLLAHLRRRSLVDRLSLGGLDEADLVRLAEARGHADDARSVYERSEGNPYFALALLEAADAAAGKAAGIAAGTAAAGDVLPEGILDVLRAQLDRLSAPARALLEAGAVLGASFDLALVAEVAGLDDRVAADGVDEALAARLVEEVAERPGTLIFGHQLVRQCLVGTASATRRTLLHHQAAEAIEHRVGADPARWAGELAHHRLASGARADPVQVLAVCRSAAAVAMAGYGYELAVEQLEQAVGVAEAGAVPVADRVPVLQDLAEALGAAGRRDRAREVAAELVAIARRHGRADWQADATLAFAGPGAEIGAADPDAEALLVEACGLAGVAPARRVDLLARLASLRMASGDIDACHATAREAMAAADAVDDPASTVEAAWVAYHALAGPDERAERAAISTRLITAARSLDDAQSRYRTLRLQCLEHAERGDLHGVDEGLAELRALADRVRQPRIGWLVGTLHAARALAAGELDEAEEAAGAALGQGLEAQVTNAVAVYAMQLFCIRREQGQLATLLPSVDAQADRPDLPPASVAFRAALDVNTGATSSAAVAELTAGFFERLPRDSMWSAALAIGSEILPSLPAAPTDVALVIRDQLAAAPDRHVVVGYGALLLGPTSRFLGEVCGYLGQQDEAIEHLGAAVRSCDLGNDVLAGTYARLGLARQLLQRGGGGDRELAVDVAAEAERTATALGLVVLAGRAQRMTTGGR